MKGTMKRIKLQRSAVPVPINRAEAEMLAGAICALKIEERQMRTDMDAQVKAIREKYEGIFAHVAQAVAPRMEALMQWAEAHPDEFQGRRSVDLLHGVAGWRMTPPAVKPMRGFTWAGVLDRLKELGRLEFIRTKEEVNKESILAARETEDLRELRVQVVQEDEFYLDAKLSQMSERETVEVK